MSENMSVLQRNVLASLAHEEAKLAFLRAQETKQNDRHSYLAEKIAREVDDLCDVLKPVVGLAADGHRFEPGNDVKSGVMDFILGRHWHSHFPKQ